MLVEPLKKSLSMSMCWHKLQDGSGFDVAERIRSKWSASPIILISGYDPSAVALRAEKLGISELLEKPFSRDVICEAVKKAIKASNAASLLLGDPHFEHFLKEMHGLRPERTDPLFATFTVEHNTGS
jgi:DNA-binding NarL/FixJ family response regulator